MKDDTALDALYVLTHMKLQRICRCTVTSGDRYRFIHKSLWEYNVNGISKQAIEGHLEHYRGMHSTECMEET